MSFRGQFPGYPVCSAVASGVTSSGNEADQQLKIWKDLAISKQMIMNEAATALRLKGEWTQDELKVALDDAIAKANAADENMVKTREEAETKIAAMQEQVRKSEKALTEALAKITASEEAKATAERQLENGRKDNSDALKKAKLQVEEKQKELKAINQSLADTPENVVKKLKTLKKQKHEEATGRTKAEEQNRKYKKQVQEQEQKLENLDSLTEDSGKLLEEFRALKKFCDETLGSDDEGAEESKKSEMPKIDHELLGRIEKLTSTAEEDAS